MGRSRTMGLGALASLTLCAAVSALAPGRALPQPVRRRVQLGAPRSSPAGLVESPNGDVDHLDDARASTSLPYDWRRQWYAVCFEDNLPEGSEPLAYSVFGHGVVIWRDEGGTLRCTEDRCPHRLARLSEGRVRDGAIQCLYHGWRFDGATGECLSIPQLEAKATVPKRACVAPHRVVVREGIVFVWMEPGADAEPDDPPVSPDDVDKLRAEGVRVVMNNIQIDLPYDASFLVENLLDPAHIDVSHDATPGGGSIANAQALEMEAGVLEPAGFRGRFRETRPRVPGSEPPWTDLAFDAPGIIRQRRETRPGSVFGAALHCMPLAAGRSRLIFRIYATNPSLQARLFFALVPKWRLNLNACRILEQDAGLIATQEDHLRAARTSVGEAYVPIASCDTFVVAYRRWLDAVGGGMPWALGFRVPVDASELLTAVSASGLAPQLDPSHRVNLDSRYERHVRHVRVTRDALRNFRRLRNWSCALGVLGTVATAALGPGVWKCRLAGVALVFVTVAGAAARQVSEFFVGYSRQDVLRADKPRPA